jgi:uncharacterized DUF497 family protein
MKFEWDPNKNEINKDRHGISFEEAMLAFNDPNRIITKNVKHSTNTEIRYFCFGKIKERIATVRFTMRKDKIRIIGAGFW